MVAQDRVVRSSKRKLIGKIVNSKLFLFCLQLATCKQNTKNLQLIILPIKLVPNVFKIKITNIFSNNKFYFITALSNL